VRPIDMVLDRAGNLVVLDRGTHPIGDPPSQEGAAAIPRLLVVGRDRSVSAHPLAGIVEPTGLAIDSQGGLIVADAQDQSSTKPAGLLRIDPANGWQVTPLLDEMGSNPLIFPTGLAFASDTALLVCDTGVRWGWMDDTWNRTMAEPAAIYRVDLAQSPPAITRVTDDRRLVMPTKIALDRGGRLIIADQGDLRKGSPRRNWRAGTHEFGVVVLFSQQRPTQPQDRDRMRREIGDELEAHKPAQTVGWIDY